MNRTHLLTLALGVSSACASPDAIAPDSVARTDSLILRAHVTPSERAVERSGPHDLAAELAAEVVAQLATDRGGRVLFHRMRDGEIAIGEVAPLDQPFIATDLLREHEATPLELYAALAPGDRAAPHALIVHHAATTAGPPRKLAPSLRARRATASLLSTPGTGRYLCWPEVANPAQRWWIDWPAAFVGITTYRAATYLHSGTPSQYFYPGSGVYYGTSVNAKTYLGACNGDDPGPIDLTVEVHRRLAGAWLKVAGVELGVGTKYTFYSGIHAAYRGYARPTSAAMPVPHYGVGAAWTISPHVRRPGS